MLKIEDLSFSYGTQSIIKNLSLTIEQNGVYAIMGPSGCGKSTLFSLISGLLKPDSGSITTDAEKLSFSFQEARLLPWETAEQNVNFVLGSKKNALQKARGALLKVGLGEDRTKYPGELSGGMQKRVSLARAFAAGGDLILLDEPFEGLDTETKAGIIENVKEIGKNSIILLITHDINEANDCAEKVFDFYELNK